MKTFAIRNGDLVIGRGGFATISGHTKLRQDISMAVIQEYGTDRFHPRYGSTLSMMVGQTINRETEMIIRSEVSRVVQQYIDTQRIEVLNDKMGFKRSRFTTAEIIRSVQNVKTSVRMDSITVTMDLRTVGNSLINMSRTVEL